MLRFLCNIFDGIKWDDIAAIIISLTALVLSLTNYFRYSKRNARKDMMKIECGLLRHLYRDYVASLAMDVKIKEYPGEYPSEEHFLKLKVRMEDIDLQLCNKKRNYYPGLHELYMLMRNYNTLIDVTIEHIRERGVELLENDMTSLKSDLLVLIDKTCNNLKTMTSRESHNKQHLIMFAAHINRCIEVKNGFDKNHYEDLIKMVGNYLNEENIPKYMRGKQVFMEEVKRDDFLADKSRKILNDGDHEFTSCFTPYLYCEELVSDFLTPLIIDVAVKYDGIGMVKVRKNHIRVNDDHTALCGAEGSI